MLQVHRGFRRCAAAALLAATAVGVALAQVPRQSAPEDARVYIVNLEDGDEVTSPFTVVFGLEGMGVAPAGVEMDGTGHHHLLIDIDDPQMDLPLPEDEQHLHFGDGQTQTKLELEPGEYTLQLVLGDHLHIPHEPPIVSERITLTVTE